MLVAPPTCSESQQAALKALAVVKGIEFVVSIPKDALGAVKAKVSIN